MICLDEMPVADSFVGAPGTAVTVSTYELMVDVVSAESSFGVTVAMSDSSLEPDPNVAETANE